MALLIAFGTDDGKKLNDNHVGMARFYLVYNFSEGNEEFIEKRNNPYENTMQHLKTLDVYELINDCDIIISGNIGKKGIKRLEEKGMKLFFRNGKIMDGLTNLLKKEKFYKM